MAAYITVGAKTSHGGTVITGSPQTTHNGVPIARQGDKVMCKKCKKVVTIATGDPTLMIDGAPIARAGDVTTCGSKLIANQQALAESDFDVMGIEPPAPLQFPKSEASNSFVDNNESYDDKFQLIDGFTGQALKNTPYLILCDGKKLLQGITDESGFTERTPKMQKEYNITILLDMEVTL